MPKRRSGKRLDGPDDAHRKPGAGQREDEEREGREIDGVAERRDALACEDDLEVAIPGQRNGEGLPGIPDGTEAAAHWRLRCLAFDRWMCARLPPTRSSGGTSTGRAGRSRLARATSPSASTPTDSSLPRGTAEGRTRPRRSCGRPAGSRRARRTSPSGLPPTSDLGSTSRCMRRAPISGGRPRPPTGAMALTLAGEVPDPCALPETALFLPRLPYLTLGVPGSAELARRIAGALTEPPEPFAARCCSNGMALSPSGPARPTQSIGSSSLKSCAGRGATRC